MAWLKKLSRKGLSLRLRALLHKGRMEEDLAEELQFHLQNEIERNIKAGMTPEEARYAALRTFGGMEQIKEECRDVNGFTVIESFLQDIRYGFRTLLHHRSFTLLTILILALGIGATSAVFSIANAVFLRSLPVEEPERLLLLTRPEREEEPFSYPEYLDYRDQNAVFSGLLAYYPLRAILGRGNPAEVIPSEIVSGNYFSVLGVSASLGRTFLPQEDTVPGAHPVAVISHTLWNRYFHSAPQAIGQIVKLNRHTYTVIGVTPEGFKGLSSPYAIDVWVPLAMHSEMMPMSQNSMGQRQARWLSIMGRLRPGVSLAHARAAMTVLDQQLQHTYPEDYPAPPDPKLTMKLARPRGFYFLRSSAAVATAFLMSVAGFVLLIACSNVANLLLARGMARGHEIAVRRAVGASRTRLVRQLLTESLLLSLLGTAAGLLVAIWTIRMFSKFLAYIPAAAAISADFPLDSRVLFLTLLLGGLTALIFGSLPAVQSSRPGPLLASKGLGVATIRLRGVNLAGWLVVAQIALSLVLVITAGLLLRSLQKIEDVQPGFQTQHQLMLSMDMTMQQYSRADYQRFSQRLLGLLRALPGVQSASLVDSLLGGYDFQASVFKENQAVAKDGLNVGISRIRPHYFETLRIPLLAGRDFNERDTAVAIVNEALAHRLWPGEEVIGRRIGVRQEDVTVFEVVGIAKDVKYRSLSEEPTSFIYVPLHHSDMIYALVRTSGNPQALVRAGENQIHALDENMVVKAVPLDEHLRSSLWLSRMSTGVTGVFAFLGILLAAIGLFGVVSYSVVCRTREMGIRMALGAEKFDVIKLVVRQALGLAFLGTVLGIGAALAVVRLLQGLLYGVSPADGLTYVSATAVLAVVTLVASFIPGRRATKVDPIVALRYE